jgi:hypothetical protein
MVEIQVAKNSCKMNSSYSDFEFLENKGTPVPVQAMTEERANIAVFDSPMYDIIDQIMENAYAQS